MTKIIKYVFVFSFIFQVDVFVDLTRGRGEITPVTPDHKNYILRVIPGETITLSCTLGYYSTNYVVQWKKEPSMLLYGSNSGPEMIPREDVLYRRLRFSPLPQDLWVREWSMTMANVTSVDQGNYSCIVPNVADAVEGRATVRLSIAYDLLSKW